MHIRTLVLIVVILVGLFFVLALAFWQPAPKPNLADIVATYEQQFGPLPGLTVSEEYTASNPELKTSLETYLTESGEQKTVKVQSCRGCHWKCSGSEEH